jgi:hypothetical protein
MKYPILRKGSIVLVDPLAFDSPNPVVRYFLPSGREYEASFEWEAAIRQGLAWLDTRLVLVWDRVPEPLRQGLNEALIRTPDGERVRFYSGKLRS